MINSVGRQNGKDFLLSMYRRWPEVIEGLRHTSIGMCNSQIDSQIEWNSDNKTIGIHSPQRSDLAAVQVNKSIERKLGDRTGVEIHRSVCTCKIG